MDIKVGSIPLSILSEAFEKIARLKILEVIVVPSLRLADISAKAPKIIVLHIRPDQIGGVIGSGGKVINEIKIPRVDAIDVNDGTIFITGKDGTAEKARQYRSAHTSMFGVSDLLGGGEIGWVWRVCADRSGNGRIGTCVWNRAISNWAVSVFWKKGIRCRWLLKVDERKRLSLSIKLADNVYQTQNASEHSSSKPEVP